MAVANAGVNALVADLSSNVVAFCDVLRTEHGFSVGHREARDALLALQALGIGDRNRVRTALRLVCCATLAQTLAFDRIFDSYFCVSRPGLPQPALAPRHTRPGREKPEAAAGTRRGATAKASDDRDDATPNSQTQARRRPVDELPADATAWQMLRARYSPAAGRGTPIEIERADLSAMRFAADRFVRSVKLGRTRRWRAMQRGSRFDIRRTMRTSLETGGDPVALRFLGHPLRNPRFVVLVDGSRSMAEHTAAVVTFAAALCERAVRARVFFFSTGLRDATADLQALVNPGETQTDFGEAWGGGTRIGANLARFVDEYGPRLLSRETLVVVYSDGLDVGDVPQLARALREIDRRSAGIVWLNPHAGAPGFSPSARGMRAALPFVTLLCAANDAAGFTDLADRIARTPRIRGRN